VIGAVHKNSPLGKTLNRIKGMFDDVNDQRRAINNENK